MQQTKRPAEAYDRRYVDIMDATLGLACHGLVRFRSSQLRATERVVLTVLDLMLGPSAGREGYASDRYVQVLVQRVCNVPERIVTDRGGRCGGSCNHHKRASTGAYLGLGHQRSPHAAAMCVVHYKRHLTALCLQYEQPAASVARVPAGKKRRATERATKFAVPIWRWPSDRRPKPAGRLRPKVPAQALRPAP